MRGAIDSLVSYGASVTVAFFEADFNADDIDEQCGYTVYDEISRQTMPSTNLTHARVTHPDPCEVWCDETKVFFDCNCQATYPDIPAGVHGLRTGSGSASAPSVTWTMSSSGTTAPPTTASSSTATATIALIEVQHTRTSISRGGEELTKRFFRVSNDLCQQIAALHCTDTNDASPRRRRPSSATALARCVLPEPGGPVSSTLFGGISRIFKWFYQFG
ncbi:hypothetical protein PC128_g23357 [Phytophthora cactorum]|nr:hypothetical protein PC128_g23357 [Phytophthora cactorum]